MRERLIIHPSCDRPDKICHDRTWLQWHTRNKWELAEDHDFDGHTVITVNFIESMEAADFRQWRSTARHILRR